MVVVGSGATAGAGAGPRGAGKGCAPAEHLLVDAGQSLLDVRIVDARRLMRPSIAARLAANSSATAARPSFSARENRHFLDFLLGEGHPVLQLGIERRLQVEIDRAMDEGAGGRDHDTVGAERARLFPATPRPAPGRSATRCGRRPRPTTASVPPAGMPRPDQAVRGRATRSRCTAATGSSSTAGR